MVINYGYLISMAGLISDIGGSLLLARSVANRSPQEIRSEGGTYYGSNVHIMKASYLSKIEAIYAIPLLVVGFMGQFVGGYIESIQTAVVSPKFAWTIASIAIAVVLVAVIYIRCRAKVMAWNTWFSLYFECADYIAKNVTTTESLNNNIIVRLQNKLHLDVNEGEEDKTFVTRCQHKIGQLIGIIRPEMEH